MFLFTSLFVKMVVDVETDMTPPSKFINTINIYVLFMID